MRRQRGTPMADQQISLENLYKLRGDAALASLEALLLSARKQVETMEAVLQQLRLLEEHYQLRRDLTLDAKGELLATMRRLRPSDTEGKSDEEILQMFGQAKP